jgi:hypothetical protein
MQHQRSSGGAAAAAIIAVDLSTLMVEGLK